MLLHLKVKIVSLAAEARIIRHYEHSLKRRAARLRELERPCNNVDARRESIHQHRAGPKESVRTEQRCAHLAYGFLRGRDYSTIEGRRWTWPDWDRVQAIAERFGDGDKRDIRQRFSEWKPGDAHQLASELPPLVHPHYRASYSPRVDDDQIPF